MVRFFVRNFGLIIVLGVILLVITSGLGNSVLENYLGRVVCGR